MSEEMIRREFPAVLEPSGDGRTLDLRIVPYNTVTRVSDRPGETYDEVWMPGAFDKQLGAANRVDVLVNFEHEQGIRGVVGRGTELRDTDEALEGTFKVLGGPDGDKALELVNEGVLTGVSLEAIPLRSVKENGVVKRLKARLVNIALCRFPAFEEAKVLAVREAPQPTPGPTFNLNFGAGGVTWGGGMTDYYTTTVPWTGTTTATAQLATVREEPEPDPEPDEPAPDEPEPLEKALQSLERRRVADALERVGYEPLVARAVTSRAWDGSPSRFTDEQYQRSCLIDRGGDAPPKSRCSLPVLEPNGDLNKNALGAAAAALAGARGGLASVTTAQKARAARRLIRYYRQADMDPPPALVSLAGR